MLQKEGRFVLKPLQIELLLALKGVAKLDALKWPGDFEYKHAFWRGYANCFEDVSKIIKLDAWRRCVTQNLEDSPKRKRSTVRGRPKTKGLDGVLKLTKEVS